MSYGSSSLGSGTKVNARGFEFGRTHVVRPKGKHEATVVWLHGLGDNGGSSSQFLETLSLPNIKWICPTAPTRPVKVFGGFPCTAWFDVGDLSEDGPDDVEGMDASAAHVANLLSTEPSDIKLGIGGFSMGAATALYSATCYVHGKYGNGNEYPANISAVVGLSGWLPCSRSLKNKLESSQDALQRAAALPLLLCHGKGLRAWHCSDLVERNQRIYREALQWLQKNERLVYYLGGGRELFRRRQGTPSAASAEQGTASPAVAEQGTDSLASAASTEQGMGSSTARDRKRGWGRRALKVWVLFPTPSPICAPCTRLAPHV